MTHLVINTNHSQKSQISIGCFFVVVFFCFDLFFLFRKKKQLLVLNLRKPLIHYILTCKRCATCKCFNKLERNKISDSNFKIYMYTLYLANMSDKQKSIH